MISRDQLLDVLHDDLRDRAVDSHIKNLRRKIDAAAPGMKRIGTVYGVGYRFEVGAASANPTSQLPAPDAAGAWLAARQGKTYREGRPWRFPEPAVPPGVQRSTGSVPGAQAVSGLLRAQNR